MVRLPPLMDRSRGHPGVIIALVDGPVEAGHPDLAHLAMRAPHPATPATCRDPASAACRHGTFVAGILAARRGSAAPAIAPGCTLMVRQIFAEGSAAATQPSAAPGELAQALHDCIGAGARVINVSAAVAGARPREVLMLTRALDEAARRGAIIVAAAGNEARIGGSAITAHPAVIPVIGCDRAGRPMTETTLGASIGRHGIAAPGDRITSLDAAGATMTMAGTSAAAPFVAGALALLWSEFPRASARLLRAAIARAGALGRRSIVPPMLDAWASFQALRGQA